MMLPYKARKNLYLVLVFALLTLFLIYTAFPLATIILTAGKTNKEVFQGPFSRPAAFFENFGRNAKDAWTTGRLGRYFANSIIMTVPSVIITLALSIPAGYSLARISFPGRDVIFLLFLTGLILPFQAIMISLYFLMLRLGLLDTYWSVIFASAGVPFGVFMMRSFFLGLPQELVDAARVDGCSEFQVFWKIMLPLVSPAALSLTVFQFMWSWNSFLIPLLFITSVDKRPVPLGLMFFQTQFTVQYNLIAAAVILSSLPVVVVYLLFQSKFEQGITLGALKG